MQDQNSFSTNTLSSILIASPLAVVSVVVMVYFLRIHRKNNRDSENSSPTPNTNQHTLQKKETPEEIPQETQHSENSLKRNQKTPTPAPALPPSSHAVNIFSQQIQKVDQAKRIGSTSSSFDSCDEIEALPTPENTGTYSPP